MICKICLNENKTFNLNVLLRDSIICNKCFKEMDARFQKFKLTDKYEVLYIYPYNSKIREMLFQFKGTRDYEMGECFLYYFKEYLHIKFHDYYLVCAPSYIEDDKKRGFNHVEVMFSYLNLKKLKIITKTERIKQADLKAKERTKIAKYLKIEDVDLSNKKILLVDDVCTTGSTLKACIKLLESKNAKTIKILVMSHRILGE